MHKLNKKKVIMVGSTPSDLFLSHNHFTNMLPSMRAKSGLINDKQKESIRKMKFNSNNFVFYSITAFQKDLSTFVDLNKVNAVVFYFINRVFEQPMAKIATFMEKSSSFLRTVCFTSPIEADIRWINLQARTLRCPTILSFTKSSSELAPYLPQSSIEVVEAKPSEDNTNTAMLRVITMVKAELVQILKKYEVFDSSVDARYIGSNTVEDYQNNLIHRKEELLEKFSKNDILLMIVCMQNIKKIVKLEKNAVLLPKDLNELVIGVAMEGENKLYAQLSKVNQIIEEGKSEFTRSKLEEDNRISAVMRAIKAELKSVLVTEQLFYDKTVNALESNRIDYFDAFSGNFVKSFKSVKEFEKAERGCLVVGEETKLNLDFVDQIVLNIAEETLEKGILALAQKYSGKDLILSVVVSKPSTIEAVSKVKEAVRLLSLPINEQISQSLKGFEKRENELKIEQTLPFSLENEEIVDNLVDEHLSNNSTKPQTTMNVVNEGDEIEWVFKQFR